MKEKQLSYNKITGLVMMIVIIVWGSLLFSYQAEEKQVQPVPEEKGGVEGVEIPAKKFKVLHIMSYHASWPWNQDQFNGFKDALEGLDIEYRVFEMDTKRRSSEEWEQIGQEARTIIDTWKPDLVYANDDDVQKYVVQHYINTDIPFVFSGVNAAPEEYGFVGSTNVTGVLEQEHFVQTVRLLKEIAPDVKKIALIVDETPMWRPVLERMKEKQSQLPEVEFISWNVIHTFETYKQKVIEYQTTADAIGLIGIFHFKDEIGQHAGQSTKGNDRYA